MSGGRISGGSFPRSFLPFGLAGCALLAFALSPKAVQVDTSRTEVHHHYAPPPAPVMIEPAKITIKGHPDFVMAEARAQQARIDATNQTLIREYKATYPTGVYVSDCEDNPQFREL